MFSCLMALVYGSVWPVAWQVLSILIDPAFRVVSPALVFFFVDCRSPVLPDVYSGLFLCINFLEFPLFDVWLRPLLGLFLLPSEVLQPLRLLCTFSPSCGSRSSGQVLVLGFYFLVFHFSCHMLTCFWFLLIRAGSPFACHFAFFFPLLFVQFEFFLRSLPGFMGHSGS